jgi:hypothetical protein
LEAFPKSLARGKRKKRKKNLEWTRQITSGPEYNKKCPFINEILK